jgi:16S rRNA (guanine966-N2)-methyltransferase
MIDAAMAAVRQLEENRRELGLDQVSVIRADALQWFEQSAMPFDIVFLDPPFDANLLEPLCQRLSMGWLADGAHIYLEDVISREMPRLPEGWELKRHKTAGQVHFGVAYAPLPG